MKILIAEDAIEARLILSASLKKWGHEVIVTKDGSEAWEILRKEDIKFVISDWMMPEMNGLDLCKKIRSANFPFYIYIILLTTKTEKSELIKGLDAGADDFISKPFVSGELHVRIRAGERILNLEKSLEERNLKLKEANNELSTAHQKLEKAYSQIERDLEAAAAVQHDLLPKAGITLSGVKFDWLFLPSAYLAGDIFNYFKLDDTHVGFYHLDVSGHGLPSALLSVTISKLLNNDADQGSPLKKHTNSPPYYELIEPSKAAEELNRRYVGDEDSLLYFTIVYAILNVVNGELKFIQAGHPYPMHMKKHSQTIQVGEGGMPVGMLPDYESETYTVQLEKGDRFIIYSDGITECENQEKVQFEERRLLEYLEENKTIPLSEIMNNLSERLHQWKGDDHFEDDVSLVALEYIGL